MSEQQPLSERPPEPGPKRRPHLAGVAAMLAGSVAVAVGLGALAMRAVRKSGSRTAL